MTTESEQLEAQSRAAIIARLNDPSVQLEYKFKTNDAWSACKDDIKRFLLDAFDYRIAKPRKFYRVGEDINGRIVLARNDFQEDRVEAQPEFKQWLDERKYYD